MNELFKNWKIWLLIIALVISGSLIAFKGLSFGLDFQGGTLFTIQLAEAVKDTEKAQQIQNTIQKRLDWTGLADARVTVLGNETLGYEFVQAQLAETDPKKIENLKSLILSQGKFEVTLDGKVIMEGEDIIQVTTNPQKGYNVVSQGNGFMWTLPFTLSETAGKKFTREVFHTCTQTGFDLTTENSFDCKKTYFFIDRPKNAVLIIPKEIYDKDRQAMLAGDAYSNISPDTKIEEVLQNAGPPYYISENNLLTAEQKNKIKSDLNSHKYAFVHSSASEELKKELQEFGFLVKVSENVKTHPWVWSATGARNIISLNPDITNNLPYVSDVEKATISESLIIRGYAVDSESAKKELEDLRVVLQSGSLPVGVVDISRETISPSFGQESLQYSIIAGILAILTVTIVLFIRYRIAKIILPILLTVFSEIFLVLGFASLVNWNLDLSSIVGLITAIGTGVNDQIIITDELTKGGDTESDAPLVERTKKAFFIVLAAAATVLATMFPILFFGLGLGKFVGFAITTIAGVLLGITITRPAFGEIMKHLLKK
ncbi:MAG: hypothetical protein Q7K42_00145 [Candidatus Diapherotrites archaeon]|nr:hypothetical protein [Candidatus Diapherotrites archaeon]